MDYNKKIEVYAFLHSVAAGLVCVTRGINEVGKAYLPVNEVEITTMSDHPRKILLRLPEYMAEAKDLKPRLQPVIPPESEYKPDSVATDLVSRIVNGVDKELNGSGSSRLYAGSGNGIDNGNGRSLLRPNQPILKSHTARPLEKQLAEEASDGEA